MSTIGFVGLGAMGSRVAGRLLDAGNTVYGTDLTRSEPLIDRGLVWAATARARSPRHADVRVQHGHRRRGGPGDQPRPPTEFSPGLARGKVYVDMSTISPQASREVRRSSPRGRRTDARRPGVRKHSPGRDRNARDHGRWRRQRLPRRPAAVGHSRPGRSPTSAPTGKACCSSSRSTSASPVRRSRSARGWCSQSAAGSIRDSRPR